MKMMVSACLMAVMMTFFAGAGRCFSAEPLPGVHQNERIAIVPVEPAPLPPVRLETKGSEVPVELRNVALRGEILGSFARTSVEMTFYNPNGRVLEGELQFPLAEGQTVTGFALDINGVMRDAVPVEKARGRQVFEEVIRRKADPALLETVQGSSFRLRVYPLPPGGTRKVRVVYTEILDGGGSRRVYRAPLEYDRLPGTCSFELALQGTDSAEVLRDPFGTLERADAGGLRVMKARADGASLSGKSVEIALSGRGDAVFTGARDGKKWLYAEIPDLAGAEEPLRPKSATILWDASMSAQHRDRGRELAFLKSLFQEWKDLDVRLQVVRDAAQPVRNFRVSGGRWDGLREALESEPCDGATALDCFDTGDGSDLYLLFTDGLDNYGSGSMKVPASPLFAVLSAAGGDAVRLRGVSEASGGTLLDLTKLKAEEAAKSLLSFVPLHVSVEGLSQAVVRRQAGRFIVLSGILQDGPVSATLRRGSDRKPEERQISLPAGAPLWDCVPQIWASMRIDDLSREYDLNRGEIRRLGSAFGLASRETSLIVLDTAEDYLRHGITPPPDLKKAAEALRARGLSAAAAEKNRLDRVLAEWKDYQKWWERDFPKGPYPPSMKRPARERPALFGGMLYFRAPFAGGRQDSVEMAVEDRSAPAPQTDLFVAPRFAAPPLEKRLSKTAGSGAVIRLQPWSPDSPYRDRMKHARTEDLYRIYLDERPDRQSSVAFFLDVSDLLFERGLEELAFRVLSNLAEMDLENRQVLRVLGYRLLQRGQTDQAVSVFRKVLRICSDEPQSFRDLGLALERAGRPQEGAETLYETVRRSFDRRFPGIEVIALTEINAMAARHEGMDLSFMDRRFIRAMPLDLRAALTWDSDNTDIDLHVIDPNGEEAFYAHPLSRQGGRVSPDNTLGYGPEDYSLRVAQPGVYRVEVNFYGHRQQLISEATTIQLDLFTDWGRAQQRRQSMTMRLKEKKDRVFVGEFEVGKNGEK